MTTEDKGEPIKPKTSRSDGNGRGSPGRDAGYSLIISCESLTYRILRQVARTGLQVAPMGRSNVKQTLGACVDPTSVGEATSADENVRLPLDNADFNVVIAWHCRDGLPLHANSSCAA